MENLLSTFRQKDYNKNPTSKKIELLLEVHLFFSLITLKSTNCENNQEMDDPAIVKDVITDEQLKGISETTSDTSHNCSSSLS